jgi:glutamate dehydrogenase
MPRTASPRTSPPERLALLDAFSLLDCADLSLLTGEPADQVVPLYFRVSERFAIDAMLHRITQLPRGDRWDALARGALRDDLYGVLKSLTLNVIEATDADEAPPPTGWRRGPRRIPTI